MKKYEKIIDNLWDQLGVPEQSREAINAGLNGVFFRGINDAKNLMELNFVKYFDQYVIDTWQSAIKSACEEREMELKNALREVEPANDYDA